MKKALLFVLMILMFVDLKGQTKLYDSFPTANAMWRESSGGYQCGCCSDYQHIIIGNLTYHKLNESGVQYNQDNQGNCTYNILYYYSQYIGAYREDTVHKKVYFRAVRANSDTLLYNFNLNIGDTLPQSLTNNSGKGGCGRNFVKSIDSVLVGNKYHKRFGIADTFSGHSTNVYVYLIEGIGSTFGLFGRLCRPFERGTHLLCFTQNGHTIYPDTITKCNVVTGVAIEKPTNYSFSISPNPLSTISNIVISPELHNADLILYNLLGGEQKRFLNLNMDIKIERGDIISSGMYFYKLLVGNKVINTGKLIVE